MAALPPVESQYKSQYAVATLVAGQASPTMDAALRELRRGLSGMLGAVPAPENSVSADGALVVGTPQSSPLIAGLGLPLQQLGREGYLIRSVAITGHKAIVIAANSDVGVLYGAFAFLRLIQTRQPIAALNVIAVPKTKTRILNHWDNLDGTIERGYAGDSIWDWQTLPEYLPTRATATTRAPMPPSASTARC